VFLKQKIVGIWTEYNNLISRIRSKNLLQLTVRSREGVIFSGEVRSITSKNAVSVFDVLPQHANFITLIEENLVIIKPNRQRQVLEIKTGLLKVWENQANVFLDVLSPIKV